MASTKQQSMRVEYTPLSEIRGWPRNPKTHDHTAIQASIQRFGFNDPPTIDEGTMRLVEGHGRVNALIALRDAGAAAPHRVHVKAGEWLVPVIRGVTFESEAAAQAYLLAHNRLVEAGGWDSEALAAMITDVRAEGVEVLGWSEDELTALLAPAVEPTAPEEKQSIPPVPAMPVTQHGDVWRMGDHRLMCGDSRDAASVAALLSGDRINVAFTSPPYASQRDYDASSGFKPIHVDEYVEWFDLVQSNVKANLASDGSWFVNIKASADGLDTYLYVHDLVLAHVRRWGWHYATEFCWERGGVPKKVTRRFKNQFEPIYQFALGEWKMRPEAVRHASDSVPIAAGKGAGNTNWKFAQGGNGSFFGSDAMEAGFAYPGNRIPPMSGSHEALGHAAAFPVGLPAFFVMAYSDPGDVVYDPFMGSGSTLIACEQTSRRSMGIEISPGYCDVIVERWQNLTGRKAVRA